MDIKEKIESLTFYGCGCEAVELFRATCGLCYQANGLGDSKKAEELYLWAKEQAEESKTWCEENEKESLNDTEQGVYDYN